MARKCPSCGWELITNPKNPDLLLCKKCNKNYKAPSSNSSDNSKKVSKKKSGGSGKIITIILVLLLVAAAIIAAIFVIKNKEGKEKVELTIPADFINEQTQKNMDEQSEKYGYKFQLNDDGSATCTMTKSQHKKMMKELKDSFNQTISEMVGSESYPNFTNIESNENFTEFTVTTKSTELDFAESFSVMAFYIYGGLFNIFSGEEVDNVSVTFINADSGQVIDTVNSSDMEQTENETQENLSAQESVVCTLGQPWVVDGKWSLTVNSIATTDQRNEYDERNPAQVFVIDYSYENIGEPDGKSFDLSYGQIVDSTGLMGYSYPGNITYYPQSAPVGATCNAQACIGVDNVSTEIRITISEYDSELTVHSATFVLPIS